MRDLQRLEKLSSTAALGLWADDVVIALDRARSGAQIDAAERELLESAAARLDEIRDQADRDIDVSRSARSLATAGTALTAIATLADEENSDEQHLLVEIAEVIRKVAHRKLESEDAAPLELALNAFVLIGEHLLAESNAVLMHRKDTDTWTATQMISSFS